MILDNETKPGPSLFLTAVDPGDSEKSVLSWYAILRQFFL